jgi:signal transduction histidine kinase
MMAASVQDEALRFARLASADYERLLEGARQLLIGLGRLPEVRGRQRSACGRLLVDLARQYPFYTNFAGFDLTGRAFCATGRNPAPDQVRASPWFIDAVNTRGFAIGPYQLGSDGEARVRVGHALVDDTNRVQGVLVASLDLTWLSDLVVQAPLPVGSTVTMVDHNGKILARFPDGQKWVGRRLPEVSVIHEMLAHGSGTTESQGTDGDVRLFGFTRLTSSLSQGGAYVVVGLPRAAAFSETDLLFRRNVTALGLAGLLALTVGWVGSGVFLRPVRTLLNATVRVRRGDLQVRTNLSEKSGELGFLGRVFDEMADALQCRQAEATHARAVLELRAGQLRALSQRLVNAQETERARIARELHDEIGQALTGIKLGLEIALRRAPDQAPGPLADIRASVNELIARVRELSRDLRPAVLDDFGLLPALTSHFDGYSRRTGIRVSFEHGSLDGTRFPPEVETAAYRIIQEALTNVARYAGVNEVSVSVHTGDVLEVRVEDHGKGFETDGTPPAGSGGLTGMRERAMMLGGEFHLASAPARGTRIQVSLPLAGLKAARDSRTGR